MFVGCAPAILRPLSVLSILRPQDVFATSLYSGDGTSKKITLPFQPDLVWEKRRNIASRHILTDSARGPNVYLDTSATDAELSRSSIPGTFYSDGYAGFPFSSGDTAVGWALKQQAKFFVRVTYTGDGTSGRVIPHALGIKPGIIIVKRRSSSGDAWYTYHRSIGAGQSLFLNQTNAATNDPTSWNSTEPTATGFTVGFNQEVNAAGSTYVAYLFAHDPDTTNGIVQCGSFTTDGSGNATINLGWSPQWAIVKRADGVGDWYIFDTARGWGAGSDNWLRANLSNAEIANNLGGPTATGFTFIDNVNANLIFIAIRAPI